MGEQRTEPLLYGLTGGIGSGKSTVAAMFSRLGFATIDADKLGHACLALDAHVQQAIAARHPRCLGPSGEIDRKALGRIVFADESERRWLEDLLHPAIAAAVTERMAALPPPKPRLVLLEGAVLLESRTQFLLNGLITVWAPEGERMARVAARDGAADGEARARLNAQLPEHTKICYATHLVDNSRDLACTAEQVRLVAGQLSLEIGGGP